MVVAEGRHQTPNLGVKGRTGFIIRFFNIFLMWILLFFVVMFVGLYGFSRFTKWSKWKIGDQHKITEEKIIDEWTALIENAAGKSDKTLEKLARAIQAEKIPNITISKKIIDLGRDPRPLLVIEHTFLRGYYMYVGALDYGERLNLVWYLVLDTPETAALRRQAKHGATDPTAWMNNVFAGGFNRVLNMSILDKLELSNYVSLVHGVVVHEVQEIMTELHLDFSKVNTHTKGFLNLS